MSVYVILTIPVANTTTVILKTNTVKSAQHFIANFITLNKNNIAEAGLTEPTSIPELLKKARKSKVGVDFEMGDDLYQITIQKGIVTGSVDIFSLPTLQKPKTAKKK